MVRKEVSELPGKSFGINRFGAWTLNLTKAIIFIVTITTVVVIIVL